LSLSFDIVAPTGGKIFNTLAGKVLGTDLELVPVRCYTVRQRTMQTGVCTSYDGVNSSLSGPCLYCEHHPYGSSATPCKDKVVLLGVWSNDPEVHLGVEFEDKNLVTGESLHRFLGNLDPITSVPLTLTRDEDNVIQVSPSTVVNDPKVLEAAANSVKMINRVEGK